MKNPKPWMEITRNDIQYDRPTRNGSLYRHLQTARATFDEGTIAHLAEQIRDAHQSLLIAQEFETAAIWADMRALLLGLPLPSSIPGVEPPKRWADLTAQDIYDDTPDDEGSLYLIIREHWYRIDALTRDTLRPKILTAIRALRQDGHLGAVAMWESIVSPHTSRERQSPRRKRGRPPADLSDYSLDDAIKDARENLDLTPPRPPRIVAARRLVEGVEEQRRQIAELEARWQAVVGLLEHHGGTLVEEAPGRWAWSYQDETGTASTAAEAVTAALKVAFLV